MIKKFIYKWLPQMENSCNVCLSKKVLKKRFEYMGENKPFCFVKYKELDFLICDDCGYSFCKENFYDYTNQKSASIPKQSKRVGDGVSPGREYFMACDAINIFQKAQTNQKKKLRVLIFASGRSRDHQLLRKLDSVSDCFITDLKNLQNSEYFIPLRTNQKFDIVIACEVAEHFMAPRKEFSNLFRYIGDNGILVVSTDIRQSKDLSHYLYPFIYGHTSYYSLASLDILAKVNDLFIDFRIPEGETFKSRSKRFIYMTKSRSVYLQILDYFSLVKHPKCE